MGTQQQVGMPGPDDRGFLEGLTDDDRQGGNPERVDVTGVRVIKPSPSNRVPPPPMERQPDF